MKWFMNSAMRTKLVLCFGLMFLCLLVMIFSACRTFTIMNQTQSDLFREDFLNSLTFLRLRSDQNRVRAQVLELMLTKDKDIQKTIEQDIQEKSKEIDAELKVVAKSLAGIPQDTKQLDQLLLNLAEYRKTRDEQIERIHAGDQVEAQNLAATVQKNRYQLIRQLARSLGDSAIVRAKERVAQTKSQMEMLYKVFIGIGLFISVFCIGTIIFLDRIIVQPLSEITSAAGQISQGNPDITMSPDITRKDEVGHLLQAFSTMINYLKDMTSVSRRIAEGDLAVTATPLSDKDVLGNAVVDMTAYLRRMAMAAEKISQGDLTVTVTPVSDKDVLGNAFVSMVDYLGKMAVVSQQVSSGDLTAKVVPISDKDMLGNAFVDMIDSLRKIIQGIGDGVNTLASSSAQILASTTQVAAGLAETATSVSQTTATVEEVKQTSQLSAEKSRKVSENAQEAALVADQGNTAVNDTIEGINHIKELMETVAESVVILSEQTQAIGDIITVVNDLAQQSNLLAVNAAIEASKAGEQGKGFVVVAHEIKSLADQSKQATEQVRSILGDIQKATGKSVLAAEQVSKAVESGAIQAVESGESIRKLSESIAGAAQAAVQIAASSQQQLAGMEQVALAMENIKQAAQQNASGTRQTEQSAHNLNELGQKLKDMASRFTV